MKSKKQVKAVQYKTNVSHIAQQYEPEGRNIRVYYSVEYVTLVDNEQKKVLHFFVIALLS